jgi:HAD superfamily hydrolase (TIGR01509 family)
MRTETVEPIRITPLEALLWDMDGTLVDTEPMWVRCEEELMTEFGYQWSERDALHCIGGPMERVQLYLKEKSKSDLEPAWFGDQLIKMMLEKIERFGAPLQPGALDLITAAKEAELALALVSASRRSIVDAVVASLPFTFDLAISASDVERSKPHPEGYLRAASELSSAMESCVIIEDSSVGITSGLESGAMVIGLTSDIFHHENFHGVANLHQVPLKEIRQIHQEWLMRRISVLER